MFSRKLILICAVLLIVNKSYSHDEYDDHHHSHERHHSQEHHHSYDQHPAFKYSEAANTKYEDHEEQHNNVPPIKMNLLSHQELWLHAMCSTLLISAAPFLILFLVPLDNTDNEQPLLKILLAFASGGLLGDAFLHLIPHAAMAIQDNVNFNSNSHSHSHNDGTKQHGHSHDMSVGLWVLTGIVAFLVVEKCVRIFKGTTHLHSHKKISSNDDKTKEETEVDDKGKGDKSDMKESVKEIKVAGYLNLAADFSHNFTDGLAIGSSYLAGNTVGIVTTITILLHEVPHEIGDFAILLQSGISRKNAMLLQLTTAVGALLGTALSLTAQNSPGALAATWILPFTAGGFIYIALVSVIPELLDEEKPSIFQTLLQLLALLGGVGMMVLIAEYE